MILAYLKPTNHCNVGCSHCYLPEAVRADTRRMDEGTLEKVGLFLSEMRARVRGAPLLVLWHGGEPLTLPSDYFLRAGEILDRTLPGHAEALQTSLIPLRDEHLAVIKVRFGSQVGTSVDFSQRKLKGSVEGYHRLFMQKVDMARSAGILVLPGMVPTIAEVGNEKAIVRWFVERGFGRFNVDRYNAYGQAAQDRPSNREHATFLCGLFDALMAAFESTGEAPFERAVAAGINGVLNGLGGDRWGGTCTGDFVVFEPDGSLNNCPDKSTLDAPFGNVEDGFQAFAVNRFRRRSIRDHHVTHKKSYCDGCENAHFCKSGCPITPNGPEDDSSEVECSGYKTFLTHVRTAAASRDKRETMEAYLASGRPSQGHAPQRKLCAA